MNPTLLQAGGKVASDWRTINELIAKAGDAHRRLAKLEHPNARRWQPAFGIDAHPFEIYQSDTWLKFKVKTGYVITTGDPFVPSGVESEFTLTSGVTRFYFVLTITPTTATITTSSTVPTWAVDLIPLGWVDTATDSGTSISTIYQFTDTHVFSPCVV